MVTSRKGRYIGFDDLEQIVSALAYGEKVFHAIKEDVLAFDILFVEVRI